MSRPGARHGLATVAIALAVGLAAHTTAAVAHAECNGGFTYETAVAHARGAIVGIVAATEQDEFGFGYATAVTVERAVGVRVGPVFHGRVGVGLCSSDYGPDVGGRVVVLLGVTFPDVPGGPWDVFYTIGRTVTAAQVASLARDLPDTATAPVSEPPSGSGWPLDPVNVIGFALVVWALLGYAIPANRSVSGVAVSTRDSRRM